MFCVLLKSECTKALSDRCVPTRLNYFVQNVRENLRRNRRRKRKMSQLQCYNKGCGQKFEASENSESACRFHPGGPIFHDALKGWSCCKKRSTDFTEFLSIPGCTSGPHNDVKPPEPVKEEKPRTEVQNEILVYEEKPKVITTSEPEERPSDEEPLISLSATVGASLKQALEQKMKSMTVNEEKQEENVTGQIAVGTSCKNSGCTKRYEDESSLTETCVYHTGVPIFHEGLKFWSCCQRKTTEFDTFLAQEGCTSGNHVWFKKESAEQKVACRYDWHQTPGFVTVSVFSKLADPTKTVIKANKVVLDISITFDNGQSVFEKHIPLQNVINPAQSKVKLLGTKVEINLKKAVPGSWSRLEYKKDS